jgi:hypothetical protein
MKVSQFLSPLSLLRSILAVLMPVAGFRTGRGVEFPRIIRCRNDSGCGSGTGLRSGPLRVISHRMFTGGALGMIRHD